MFGSYSCSSVRFVFLFVGILSWLGASKKDIYHEWFPKRDNYMNCHTQKSYYPGQLYSPQAFQCVFGFLIKIEVCFLCTDFSFY